MVGNSSSLSYQILKQSKRVLLYANALFLSKLFNKIFYFESGVNLPLSDIRL